MTLGKLKKQGCSSYALPEDVSHMIDENIMSSGAEILKGKLSILGAKLQKDLISTSIPVFTNYANDVLRTIVSETVRKQEYIGIQNNSSNIEGTNAVPAISEMLQRSVTHNVTTSMDMPSEPTAILNPNLIGKMLPPLIPRKDEVIAVTPIETQQHKQSIMSTSKPLVMLPPRRNISKIKQPNLNDIAEQFKLFDIVEPPDQRCNTPDLFDDILPMINTYMEPPEMFDSFLPANCSSSEDYLFQKMFQKIEICMDTLNSFSTSCNILDLCNIGTEKSSIPLITRMLCSKKDIVNTMKPISKSSHGLSLNEFLTGRPSPSSLENWCKSEFPRFDLLEEDIISKPESNDDMNKVNFPSSEEMTEEEYWIQADLIAEEIEKQHLKTADMNAKDNVTPLNTTSIPDNTTTNGWSIFSTPAENELYHLVTTDAAKVSPSQWLLLILNTMDGRFDVLNPNFWDDQLLPTIDTVIINFRALFLKAFPFCKWYDIKTFEKKFVHVPKVKSRNDSGIFILRFIQTYNGRDLAAFSNEDISDLRHKLLFQLLTYKHNKAEHEIVESFLQKLESHKL